MKASDAELVFAIERRAGIVNALAVGEDKSATAAIILDFRLVVCLVSNWLGICDYLPYLQPSGYSFEFWNW